MTDIAREKFIKLMDEISKLEERVEELESEIKNTKDESDSGDLKVFEEELSDLRNFLANKRNELSRLSDGCGKPHTINPE